MIDTLAIVLPCFPGTVNHAQCLAHIVNLVSKIILHQFDATAKKNKNYQTCKDETVSTLDEIEGSDDLTDLENGFDQRNTNEDDEENKSLTDEIKEIERAMSDEIDKVVEQAKPVQHVLFKVCDTHIDYKFCYQCDHYLCCYLHPIDSFEKFPMQSRPQLPSFC